MYIYDIVIVVSIRVDKILLKMVVSDAKHVKTKKKSKLRGL
jgi:hypothetical protein